VPVSFTAQNSPSTEGVLPFEYCGPTDVIGCNNKAENFPILFQKKTEA
jgi:hypothetical protein